MTMAIRPDDGLRAQIRAALVDRLCPAVASDPDALITTILAVDRHADELSRELLHTTPRPA